MATWSLAQAENSIDFEPRGVHTAAQDEIESEILRLYELHAGSLFRFGLSLICGEDGVRDAVQEVFLRYFVARNAGQRIENQRAWLFRVMRNYATDLQKSSNGKTEVGLEQTRDFIDWRQDPEAGLQYAELTRKLWSELAPRELECLRLKVEGFNYGEIAEILAIQPGTVGATLVRTQRKLRRVLDTTEGSEQSRAGFRATENSYAP